MYKPLAAAVIAANLSAPQALAQTMEELLVTGSHMPQPELTANVTVINRTMIDAQNVRSVVDVLRLAPGLTVEEQGGAGGLTAVSMRGGDANFTLVMIDGVPVNDPTNTRGGSFDFSKLDPAVIERIEIVRGAQSAIYGSDALSGVINIITHREHTDSQIRAGGSWGEDDFASYHASASGATERLHYSAQMVHRDDGEQVTGSTRQADQADLRLRWQALDSHAISLGYRYNEGDNTSYPEQSGGPELAVSDALDQGEYRDALYSLGWQATLSARWTSLVTASRVDQRAEVSSPGIAPYTEVPPNGSDTDYERDQVRWVNQVEAGAATTISLGADYRDETGKSVGYVDFFGLLVPTDFALDRDTTGVFAGISTELGQTLLVQASARYDDPEGFDTQTTAGAGLRWQPLDTVSVRANWSQAYKLPSFFALGHGLVGNPDLLPEEAETWDIGLSWQREQTEVSATLFHNEYTNLIDFDDATFRNVNRGSVDSQGIEARVAFRPTQSIYVDGQLTYTEVDVRSDDVDLPNRPEWQAAASATWDINPRWSAAALYRYTGEQYSVSRHTGEAVQSTLDDYHLLDLSVNWRPANHWRIALSADNVFDEDYYTAVGFPGPGVGIRLGLNYALH